MKLAVLNELIDDRANPDARAVLEDATLSSGAKVTRLGSTLWMIYSADADDDDDDDDADAADDDADDADAAAADDDAADDDADADDADADAADDADDRRRKLSVLTQNLSGDLDMRAGLKLILIPGGYYGRSVTMVGWLRRAGSGGDEWLVYGARTIRRTGSYRIGGFALLAKEGPAGRYELSPESPEPEEVHRLLIRRALAVNVKKWTEHCPKPKDWDGE